ncbi:hypothetical protein SteCoe_13071 [Stentor coeruleus]|uniref:Uncharacterized protein n=1 Tax=Stentor coeruleus TaxID=5963 RepID=A0A1R2C9A7_9CILI|nr:hypothetical protein SteCoe_13071 [Stentor coeruleus]
MHSSKSIRIRKCLISPEYERHVKMCLTPKEMSRGLNIDLEIKPKIISDPFKNLQIGKKSRLKPVALKTNKRCIINETNASSSSNILEPSRYEDYTKSSNKTFLPRINKEKCNLKSNLRQVASFGAFEGIFSRNDSGRFDLGKIHKANFERKKRVTFCEKNLETFFDIMEEKDKVFRVDKGDL